MTVLATLKKDFKGEIPKIYDSSMTCFDTLSYTYDNKGRVAKEENSDGSSVSYEYDAWGKITSVGSTHSYESYDKELANINPLRYRGYYLDSETGYYYLQSRYYDPDICRFINADNAAYLNKDSIVGMNSFSYCENDPINCNDNSGRTVISAILGAIIGMVFGALGFFLDIIIDNIGLLSNLSALKNKISNILATVKGKAQLIINVLLGGIDGALSTTNKYQLFKNIYSVIATLSNGIRSGLDVISLVIECIVSYMCSKLLKTEQTFSKFNSNKIRGKGRALMTNFNKFSSSKMKEFVKIIKNQIVYYVKSNKKVYQKYLVNYSLTTVSSWTSKLPQLDSAIQKLR